MTHLFIAVALLFLFLVLTKCDCDARIKNPARNDSWDLFLLVGTAGSLVYMADALIALAIGMVNGH